MKRKNYHVFLFVAFLLFAFSTKAQEVAPLKTFDYQISLNKLKTENQAQLIKSEVSKIQGVKSCELVLIEYNLTFSCTNHDMERYSVMDLVKEVVVSNGSEIVNIKRTQQND